LLPAQSKVKTRTLTIKGCGTQFEVSYVAEFFIADIGSEKFYAPPAREKKSWLAKILSERVPPRSRRGVKRRGKILYDVP
jgi:hypothetical protein